MGLIYNDRLLLRENLVGEMSRVSEIELVAIVAQHMLSYYVN
jgi:hypothetical protein